MPRQFQRAEAQRERERGDGVAVDAVEEPLLTAFGLHGNLMHLLAPKNDSTFAYDTMILSTAENFDEDK